MRTIYNIPVQPWPIIFRIEIGARTFQMSTQYREAPEAGWVLDIADQDNAVVLVRGIPLVSGLDLLYQYSHYEFGFAMVMDCKDGRDTPTFETLGDPDRLLAVVDDGSPVNTLIVDTIYLGSLALNNSIVAAAAPAGTQVGTILGKNIESSLALIDDGGGYFVLRGLNLFTRLSPIPGPTRQIVIRETHKQVNQQDTPLTITVTS